MILDGFGLNDKKDANAVYEAKTPVIDNLMATYPFVKGNASGLSVGLPEGQMGNSEVGHMNIGAGRIVYQDLTRITKEIQDGTFFENPALLKAIENVKANNSALHLYGLLSDGGVHSHNTHLYGCWSWQNVMDLSMSMFTASWMAVIHRRHQVQIISKNYTRRCRNWVLDRLLLLWAVTMPWTVTTDGTV